MKETVIPFEKINPFEMLFFYNEFDMYSPNNTNHNHTHDECEIYINLSGDVSFEVEGAVYPIVSGNVIITRPHEYHHCIYHSNKLHRHYWILFSVNGNERLFDAFFNRPLGKGNLLTLSPEKKAELFSVCNKIKSCDNECERYCLFFTLINLINNSNSLNAPKSPDGDSVIRAVNLINAGLSEKITVAQIAKSCNVSVNTLERHFTNSLGISPYAYIKKKRLTNAARLLSLGKSVTEAAELSGFSDVSSFISIFKASYGITPLKYKKLL